MQSNTPALSPFERRMNEISGCLNFNITNAQRQAIFPAGVDVAKLGRIALRTIRLNPKLAECTPESLVSSIIEAAGLGLEIDSRGLAYFVPYGQKAQLIIGYKGFIELAYRSGKVTSIYAEVVCQNDEFEYEMGLYPRLKHVPALGDRGPIQAVYAVAKMTSAEPMFTVLSLSDIERVRKNSAKTSNIWSMWPEAMMKKTAIRRLCKVLPMSSEVQVAVSLDEQAEFKEEPLQGQYEVEIEEPKKTVSQRMGMKKEDIVEAEVVEEHSVRSENIQRMFAEFIDNMGVDGVDAFKVVNHIASKKKITKDDAKVYAINNPAEFSKLLPEVLGK